MAPLLEVGSIARAHGIRGEVLVSLITNRPGRRLDPGSVLLGHSPLTGPGSPSPARMVDLGDAADPGRVMEPTALRVVSSRPHGHRWIVAFEGVRDRNQAESLRGWRLAAGMEEPDPAMGVEAVPPTAGEVDGVGPGTLWVHQMIGSQVTDSGGRGHGRVVAVEAQPASDLLVLESGALIPLVFVVGQSPGRLVVDVPAGLLDD
ncbi:MAG: ribosome maturation factor RimM [Acidimicrobiales bacterium]